MLFSLRCVHIDGLVQDCSISSALAMEILQSCTKPSTIALDRCWPLIKDWAACTIMQGHTQALAGQFADFFVNHSLWKSFPSHISGEFPQTWCVFDAEFRNMWEDIDAAPILYENNTKKTVILRTRHICASHMNKNSMLRILGMAGH